MLVGGNGKDLRSLLYRGFQAPNEPPTLLIPASIEDVDIT